MIDQLTGSIVAFNQNDRQLLLLVGPITLALNVPETLSAQVNSTATLFTRLIWSSEDGPSLFGFATMQDRDLFELLIACSGTGPQRALALLSRFVLAEFVQAVQQQDAQLIAKTPGFGIKKAEQLLLQLKHKIDNFAKKHAEALASQQSQDGSFSDLQNIREALTSLNYSKQEIAMVCAHLAELNRERKAQSLDQLLRVALTYLSGI